MSPPRAHRYTRRKQSGPVHSGALAANSQAQECVWAHRYTRSKQSGPACGERVPVHYEQTVTAPPAACCASSPPFPCPETPAPRAASQGPGTL